MTDQELRERALEEVRHFSNSKIIQQWLVDILLRWRAEGQAEEREACVRLGATLVRSLNSDETYVYNDALSDYAAVIRARGGRGEHRQDQAADLYCIQNRGFVGNCLRWWRPNGSGYTCNLDDAWMVSKEKADEICRIRRGEDVAWPVASADLRAERHVRT